MVLLICIILLERDRNAPLKDIRQILRSLVVHFSGLRLLVLPVWGCCGCGCGDEPGFEERRQKILVRSS